MKAIAAIIGLILLVACATAVPQVSILNVSTQIGNLTPTNLNGFLIGNGTYVSVGIPTGLMNQTPNQTAGPAGAAGGSSGQILYFNNTASDIAGYESLRTIPSTAGNVDEAISVSSGTGAVLVDSYATPSLNTTTIPAGLWEIHTYDRVSANTGITTLRVDMYNRTAGGTETLLFSATSGTITGSSTIAYITDYVTENNIQVLPTDRLVAKIYGQTTSVPALTFHFVYQGNLNTSHIHTPLATPASSASSLVAAAGESIPVILGDNAGATNISIRNYSNGQVASIDSMGNETLQKLTGRFIGINQINPITPIVPERLIVDESENAWPFPDVLSSTERDINI